MQPANPDEQQLKLLATLHYVWAALQAFTGLIGVLFIAAGAFIAFMPQVAEAKNPPPAWFGAIFAGFGVMVVVLVEAMAVLTFLVARYLSRRTHHTYCMVMSGINCLSIPFGTALGIFTILTLQKPSVRATFDGAPPMPTFH
jgi:heme/copper-type cytochrome/quinol oxidase subunit 2